VTGSEEGEVQARVVEAVLGLFDRAGYAVLIVDPSGRHLAHNERFGRRIPSREVLVPPSAPSLFAEGLRRAAEQGIARFETSEPPLLRPDGARWQLEFVPFGRGGETCVAVIYEPVSGAHPGPAASLDERFRALVDGAMEGMLICRGSLVLFANRAAARLLGHPEQSALVGAELGDCLGERVSSWVGRMDDAFDTAGMVEVESELLVRSSDGREREAFARLIQVPGTSPHEPRLRLLFFWILDGSEWRRGLLQGEALMTMLDVARKWGEELDVLSQVVERLVKTPGASPSVSPGQEWDEVRDGLERLKNRVARPSWCDETREHPVWIEQLVGGLVSPDGRLLNIRNDALREADVLVDVEPSVHPLANSAGASVAAVTCLVRHAAATLAPSRALWISGLRDRTAGQEPRYTLRFGPERGGQSGDPHARGTLDATWDLGLGLEVAYACATLEQAGHRVQLLSNAEGARTVVIDFLLEEVRRVDMQPLATTFQTATDGPRCAGDPVEPPSPQPKPGEQPPTEVARGRILICDDEPRLLQLTQCLLEEFGYEVVIARSGREALARFAEQHCDVVMLDVSLPEENPWDVAEGLRLTGLPVKVLLCSGYSEEDIDPVLLGHPLVRAFLGKPYAVDLLVSTIERLCEPDPSDETARRACPAG